MRSHFSAGIKVGSGTSLFEHRRIHRSILFFAMLLTAWFVMSCAESKTKFFTETAPIIRSLRITTPSFVMTPGSTRSLDAVLIANDSSIISGRRYLWESTRPEVVTVDQNGIVTSHATLGRAYITASIEGIYSNTIGITVANPLAHFAMTPDSASVLITGTVQLSWSIRDSADNSIDVTPALHSRDTTVALVDPSGLVTGKSSGRTWIIGNVSNLYDSTVVVVANRYDSLSVNPMQLTLQTGDTTRLTAIAWFNNTPSYPENISWRTTNPNIVTLLPNGTVIARDSGSCVITAATGNVVSRPVITQIMPLQLYGEYVLYAADGKVFQYYISTGVVRRTRFNADTTIIQLRRNPTATVAATLDASGTISICDLTSGSQYHAPGIWSVNRNTIGWSRDGLEFIAMGSDERIYSMNVVSRQRTMLPLLTSNTNTHWSNAPQLSDSVWIIANSSNGINWYYYAFNRALTLVDSTSITTTSFGPARVIANDYAIDCLGTDATQVSLVAGRLTLDVLEDVGPVVDRLLTCERTTGAPLYATRDDILLAFSFTNPITWYEVNPRETYSHYAFEPNPLTFYGINPPHRIVRWTPAQQPVVMYLTTDNITAIDR